MSKISGKNFVQTQEFKSSNDYLNNPLELKGRDENEIAKFTRIRPMHPFLQASVPLKKKYGFGNPKLYPKVAGVIGSAMRSGIGTSRAVGASMFRGSSAYYVYGGRPQSALFRNPDVRLQFPHLQRKVADVIQVPPKMYELYYTPPESLELVL